MVRYEYENMKILLEDEKLSKINIANQLGISRPTLDNWLTKYRRDNALILEYGNQNIEYIIKLEEENIKLKEQIEFLGLKKPEDSNQNGNNNNVTNTIDMAWEKIFK